MQTAEQIAAEQLEKVRTVLLGLSDEHLASIGVTIERDDSGWVWLKDAFIEALEADGRWRAARSLRSVDLSHGRQYSIGLSKSFLIRLGSVVRAILKEQNNEQQ